MTNIFQRLRVSGFARIARSLNPTNSQDYKKDGRKNGHLPKSQACGNSSPNLLTVSGLQSDGSGSAKPVQRHRGN